MFTGITNHAGALVTAVVVLTGAAILCCGAAAADPNQDDQFLALLDKEEIPAVKNVPSVIAAGHKVCRKLDNGTPVDDLVDAMRNDAYNIDPIVRRYPVRVTSTVTRFITAAVEAYCPYDQGKIVSIMATSVRGSNEPTHRVAVYWRTAVNSGSGLRELPSGWQEPTGVTAVRLPHLMGGSVFGDVRSYGEADGTVLASLIDAVLSGEITPPNPPQIPAPPPPTAQIRTPPRAIAAPPPPQAPPPPPQEPPQPPPQAPPPPPEQAPPPEPAPPAPQQLEPPAAPQPGGAPGSGGSGSGGGSGRSGSGGGNGGGGPEEPSPPMPPGFVRLAP